MRIFQVLEKNTFDTGSVLQMFQAAVSLRRRGHDVTIISRPGHLLQSKAEENDVRFRALPLRHQFDARSVVGMRRLIDELKPDVIHVHKGIAHAVVHAALFRKRVGALVVNRGVSFPLDRWNRGKYRAKQVDRVVTVCRRIKSVIVDSGGLPDEKVEVVYAGTDISTFDPARSDRQAFRREKNIADDRFLIAQVGVREWKGWKELTNAVAAIAPRYPNVHLLMIGCRDEESARAVRDYAAQKGMSDRVTAVEVRADMPNVFASCDLVVDASWAGTGITGTVREAMAMEKPVIATDSGGNAELVSSAAVGWLIPMRDEAALERAILEVIADPERAEEVGRRARQHVAAGFSSEQRVTLLENLYRRILESKS